MSNSDIESCSHYAKIHTCALGTAFGLTWGLGMLCLSLCFIWFNIGGALLTSLGSIYVGYEGTYLGGLIGLFWGLVDGFIGGVILGFFYNRLLTRCPVCKCFCSCKKKEK